MPKSPETNANLPLDAHLERMTVDDIADVVAIERTVFADAWSVESFLAEVERNPEIGWPVVIRDESEEGRVIAYAVTWFIVDEVHIGNIAVHPDHQGRGLGRALLSSILAAGVRRGMVYATLEVRPSNAAALALYESFGFRQVARRKSYYRDNQEDALVLALHLQSEDESIDE